MIPLLLALFAPVASAQGGLTLLTVDRDSELLRTIDPITGQPPLDPLLGLPVDPVPITILTQPIFGANGLAQDPTTGKLYALARLQLVAGIPHLITIDDLTTGAATDLGLADPGSGLAFANIAFSSDGTLFGITGDGTAVSLFVIDKTNGSATLLKALGSGNNGEAIVVNPGDNLIYRASGLNTPVLQTLDPGLLLKPAVNLDLSLDRLHEASSLAYFRGDFFLWADTDRKLFLLNKNGRARFLSNLDHVPAGMAFIGSAPQCPANAPLYGSAHQGPDGPALLFSIDPATGTASMIGPTGFERLGSIAFRSDGTLFGAGERMDGSNAKVLTRIEPCTGLATAVGTTGLQGNVTDLSFRPSDGALFAMTVSSANIQLATLNTSTGAGTNVAPINTFGNGNGLAFDSGSALYHADGANLSTIDPSNGAMVLVAPLSFSPPGDGLPALNALSFNPADGVLFASHNDGVAGAAENYLSTVDIPPSMTAGTVNIIGPTQGGLDGIAFRPAAGAPPAANVGITILGAPSPVTAGQTLTYTLTIANSGPGAANSVFVTDSLPAVLRSATAVPSQGTCSQGTAVLCNLGTIANGGTATVTVSTRVVVSASGTISNTASVSTASSDGVPGNNSATSTITASVAPSLNISVDAFAAITDPTAVGKPVVFSTTVRNMGGAVATQVSLWISLSSGKFSLVQGLVAGVPGCTLGSLAVICDLTTISAGGTKAVSITVVPWFVRSLTATATVFSLTSLDGTQVNNTTTAVPQVRPRPFTRPGQGLRIP